MKSVPVVAFDYHVSRGLIAAVAGVLALGIVALLLSDAPMLAIAAASLVAAVYAVHSLKRFLADAPTRAALQASGHWLLRLRNGDEVAAEWCDAIVRGPFIVLSMRRDDRRRFALILTPDNSNAELRRQLRVRIARGIATP